MKTKPDQALSGLAWDTTSFRLIFYFMFMALDRKHRRTGKALELRRARASGVSRDERGSEARGVGKIAKGVWPRAKTVRWRGPCMWILFDSFECSLSGL